MHKLAKAALVAGCTLLSCTFAVPAQTILSATSSGNTGAAPNGIAATSSGLFFTQPYCSGQQSRGIYQENIAAGTSTKITSLPDGGTGVCSENYLAISAGQGGFTAGDTYATGASTTNPTNSAVYKNGSLFIDGLASSQHHAGIAFDTVGTFGFDLIVTTSSSVIGYNPAGAVQFTYSAPSGFLLEAATVAPLTYAQCPGCLFVTAEPSGAGSGAIYTVSPGAASGTSIALWSVTPFKEPEGLVFVDNNLSCSLNGYDYFVSGYATDGQIDNNFATNGALLAYTPAQLTPYKGQILVPDEGAGAAGKIYAFSAPGVSTVFSSTAYQLEGSTSLTCLGNGCPATFGYWKHHPFPSSMFVSGVASIGCQSYTSAELLAILNHSNSGGNAVTILGHQLIAAIANYDAGGAQTPAATAAIAQATALLCANGINMSTSVVSSGSTLGQQMVDLSNTLDAYNSSAPSCEGNGLSSMRKSSKKNGHS